LLCLQHDTITYDEQFVKISEWGSLKEKIKRYRTELASLLEKNNVIVSDISISTELLIEQINDIYNQYISSNCSMRIIQQILNELSDLVLNPDCYACINNPQFKKKNQLKLELEELEMRIKQLRARFLDAVKSLDLEIENFDSIEEVYSYTNDFIKKKRIKRSEELKKKELYSKKVNYYSNQIKIYENTNSYMLKKDCLEKKKCIENDLMSHPLKMKYEELLSFIKNMSIYDQLNISFQKKCKNHEQIRNELNKCLETEKKLIQSSDRISRINEELYTLNKDKNHLDIELQNLEKEIGIIKSNQEYILKKNSIEESRQSIMKEIKELNDQIIIKKTDFERIRTEHKEWLNNYDHHVDILKKIDSIQKIIECVDRDGLPLYLLNNYLPIIEANINDIIHIFLDKKMVFRIVEKDIIIGLNENGTISNFLGGMESFIFDLTLKMTFSKFSRQSRSNFFIIDEGISVFDQDRINNIHVLLNFLTGISEKTFLISHIPSIKDFVSQSIEVIKGDDKKSHLVCCF
jgi:DNA repair exonuclease SbcCD ATPase subunit